MKVNDAVSGALLLAFGLAVIIVSWSFPTLPNQVYGAATFPILIGAGLVAVSLAMIVRGVAEWRTVPGVALTDWGRSAGAWLRLGLTILLVVGYILFSARLGFVPTAFLILITLFAALGVRWFVALPVAALATLAIQQAFGVLLRVPLPRGEFLSFLW